MKKINWSYAFGEIALIFIGITLAIAFQNWNENRKQNKLEQSVLKQLKVALQHDLDDVKKNIYTHERGLQSCQNVLEILEDKEPIDPKALLVNIGQSADYTFLVSDVSTYEYLKSIGLHIIQTDSLRNQITKLYDVTYESIYGIEDNVNPVTDRIGEDLRKYYSSDATFFTPRKNINKAKSDDDLKFDIRNLAYSHNNMATKYKNKVLPELERLIGMIDDNIE